ncbi:MAG: stage V sporulation protein AD [Clostridia bacterium]
MDEYYNCRTIEFKNSYFSQGFTFVGPKEAEGKLGKFFDLTTLDDKLGQKTFEKAERKFFENAIYGLVNKCGIELSQVDAIVGGDLLNQIVSVAFGVRDTLRPFLGLYNACGTYVESLIVGSILVDNYYDRVICLSGSHFSTAERQYRYPLELGVFRSPVSQWTATGVGCTLLANNSLNNIRIVRATIGRVVDYGILDLNNMGAAMAPSAYDTLLNHFTNTNTTAKDYDLILTGDLGKLGKSILIDLAHCKGIDLSKNLADCGASLYHPSQKTYMGGSGAACSAIVVNSLIYQNLVSKRIKRMLVIGTGALMSPTTSFQGESIPAIAHCVEITSD